MNPYNFSVLCFGFCSLLLGIFVRLRRQDEIGSLYLSLSVVYAGWATIISISLSDNISYNTALLTARIANAFAAFVPVAWIHFCLVFTQRFSRNKKWLLLLYINTIVICLFAPTKWFIPYVRSIVGFKFYPAPGIVYYFNTFSYVCIVAAGFWLLNKRIKELRGIETEQARGLFWASLIGYVGGTLTFVPIYGIPLPQYGLFLLPIYPFAMAYFLVSRGLLNAEEIAQAAHRDKLTAIGVLAASINHEVKNPLFIIKGLSESCLERQKEGIFPNKDKALESANDALKRSVAQADRAMDIIKRLSLFAKAGIDSEMKFELVEIAQVVEDILPLVRFELAAHNIALVRDIPQNLPKVRIDRRYFEEILFNLLVNACQALREKSEGGEIVIRGACVSGEVCVTIKDNGSGIHADKLKDVFRPFYTTKAEGTGLGLYITKQLIEKVSGRIDVRSEIGGGTTFTLQFSTQ